MDGAALLLVVVVAAAIGRGTADVLPSLTVPELRSANCRSAGSSAVLQVLGTRLGAGREEHGLVRGSRIRRSAGLGFVLQNEIVVESRSGRVIVSFHRMIMRHMILIVGVRLQGYRGARRLWMHRILYYP